MFSCVAERHAAQRPKWHLDRAERRPTATKERSGQRTNTFGVAAAISECPNCQICPEKLPLDPSAFRHITSATRCSTARRKPSQPWIGLRAMQARRSNICDRPSCPCPESCSCSCSRQQKTEGWLCQLDPGLTIPTRQIPKLRLAYGTQDLLPYR